MAGGSWCGLAMHNMACPLQGPRHFLGPTAAHATWRTVRCNSGTVEAGSSMSPIQTPICSQTCLDSELANPWPPHPVVPEKRGTSFFTEDTAWGSIFCRFSSTHNVVACTRWLIKSPNLGNVSHKQGGIAETVRKCNGELRINLAAIVVTVTLVAKQWEQATGLDA